MPLINRITDLKNLVGWSMNGLGLPMFTRRVHAQKVMELFPHLGQAGDHGTASVRVKTE